MTIRRQVVPVLFAFLAAGASLADEAPAGRLRGEVRTPALKPIVGATVVAVRSEAPPTVAITSTDTWGLMSFDAVPGGTWQLVVSAPGFAASKVDNLTVGGPFRAVADVTLKPGDGVTLPVALPRGQGPQGLAVRVVGDKGQALPGVRVQLEPIAHRADPIRAETGPDGTVRLPALPGGRWRVVVVRAGWTRLAVPALEVDGSGVTILARLLPLPEGAPAPLEELLPPARLIES